MEHYYTNQPTSDSEERELIYQINDKKILLTSDNGVFAKKHVDIATNFMLNILLKEDIKGKVLDLGCGYGVIRYYPCKIFQNWLNNARY